jgi:hypothetical protein
VPNNKETDKSKGKKPTREGGDLFENIIGVEIEDQMQTAYIDYAMSVIYRQGSSGYKGRSKAGTPENSPRHE